MCKTMDKSEVLLKFCALSTKVATERFGNLEASDCFCGGNEIYDFGGFQFSQKVLEFIEQAVDEKLNRLFR